MDQSAGAGALRDGDVSAIRDRVNKALSTTQGTLKHQARAVTKLHNRGILIELNSDEAVDWFQDSEIRKTFLSHLHPSASIKPRLYNVVVQFVLLAFCPGRESDLWEIEEVNGIEEGGIFKARWIKLAACRVPGQVCSHVILSFLSLQSTNDALANGLFLCQKKVYTEKCKREPLHCLSATGGTT